MDAFSIWKWGMRAPGMPEHSLSTSTGVRSQSTAIIWTLNLDLTPIYAIQPAGMFGCRNIRLSKKRAQKSAARAGQERNRSSRTGIGTRDHFGRSALWNNMVVPVIVPELRGMFDWSTKALVSELKKMTAAETEDSADHFDPLNGLENFLRRIYEECRNLGASPQDRAKNYAATNAFSLLEIFSHARSKNLHMEVYTVGKSPICRPDSDCWDIHLRFYHPEQLFHHARHEWIITVDVSDVVPVIVGKPRHWTTV